MRPSVRLVSSFVSCRASGLWRLLPTKRALRYYSNQAPKSQTSDESVPHARSMLPYFVGGVAGIATVGGAGYAYYHLSGAKKVVDKAIAVKERYTDAKAVVADKHEAVGEQVRAMAEAARNAVGKKREALRKRWDARLSRRGTNGDRDLEDK